MNTYSPTVRRVLRGDLCSGCGLCASLSGTSMRAAPPGYNRPDPDLKLSPGDERTVADACPGSKVAPWDFGDRVHPYWGPWQRIGTGAATDERVRHIASSGGAVTGLALHALANGLIDRVVHVTPDPERPTRNLVVVSSDPEEIVQGAGSRYAASSPLEAIDAMLSDGGKIGFIGKPCDASALRRLGLHDPRVAAHVPLVLSFFCAGVPSETGARRILDELGVGEDELAQFRYRGHGWPGLATATARDGRSETMTYARSWGHHLSREVQFRCKICPDAIGGVADIACADAWYGGDAGYPSFEEESGRSLMVTRTPAGGALLDSALTAGAMTFEPLDIAEIDKMQPGQTRRKRLVRARLAAMATTFQPRPDVTGLKVAEASHRAGAKEALHNYLGTIRRIVTGRR